jgi:glucose/arabinose dehydrogenase
LIRLVAAAVAAFTLSARATPAQTLTDGRFQIDTVASLPPFTPVGMAFAPDGRIFFWQKSGVVYIVKDGALLGTPFADISDHVNNFDDRGMLGLALDPAFDTNGYVYLFYVYEEGGDPANTGPKTGRLTRIQADPANPDHALPGEIVILGSIGTPPCSSQPTGADCIGFDVDSHTADTLRFARDGTLFLSLGDGAAYWQADVLSLRAQSLDHYEGKILRIWPDGTAPPDNPFYDGSNSIRSKVYDFGLRNPFRFTLEPTSGEPVIGDVGADAREEIDFGRGKNFGWPCYEGELVRPEFAALSPVCAALPAGAVTFGAYTYDHTIGETVIGGPVYSASVYPAEYQGAYFFADYSGDWMRYGRLDASGVLQNVQLFGTGMGGLVDLQQGPDGALYYVAFNAGELRRIRFAQGSNATATYRINAGGPAYVDTIGQVWSADQGFNTGQAAATSDPIADPNATLYRSERWDPSDGPELSYDLPVGNGSYRVNLYFAEIYPGAAFEGGRVFDVSIEGTKVLQNLDIFAQVGFEKPLVKSFTTTVSDGVLDILFSHVVENPKISAIEVIPLSSAPPPPPPPPPPPATAIRVNAGGPPFTDSSGNAWEADRNFNTGDTFTSALWTGPNAALYGTERWDPADATELSYSFSVTPGTYTVRLHFAEIYFTSVGSRVFDVYIDGTKMLDKLDIVNEVGPMAPLVESFTVNETGNSLTISFAHEVENPKISGIEILPASPPPPPPPAMAIRVNAGGPPFTDSSGNAWDADRNFNTGDTFTSALWSGPNAALYGTERWDPPDAPELSYSFPVTPGTYTVRLHFAEIYFTSAGSRVFDVYIDGTKMLDKLDIVNEVGPMVPLVETFTVNETGNSLTISFAHEVENPKISGIEIVPQ